jgi:hypothetical protein
MVYPNIQKSKKYIERSSKTNDTKHFLDILVTRRKNKSERRWLRLVLSFVARFVYNSNNCVFIVGDDYCSQRGCREEELLLIL